MLKKEQNGQFYNLFQSSVYVLSLNFAFASAM